MAHKDEPLPLARVQLAQELLQDYGELLPDMAPDEVRRVGGEQEIIARYERDEAIRTLPILLAQRKDRERLLSLLERVLADKRVQRIEPSSEQLATLARIRSVLGGSGLRTQEAPARRRAVREAARQAG